MKTYQAQCFDTSNYTYRDIMLCADEPSEVAPLIAEEWPELRVKAIFEYTEVWREEE